MPSETTPTGWHGWPADAPPPAIAPFNAQQAQQHQEAWAKYLKVPVEYTNSIGLKLKLIPPGEFLMGATQAEVNANIESYDKAIQSDPVMFSPAYRDLVQGHIRGAMPRHKVVLTQPLYLGEHEVTQAEFELVLGHNPSNFAPTGSRKDFVVGLDTTEHPVEMVSWADAAEFCAKLSQREQLQPYYLRMRGRESVTGLDGTGYRLPTEAEWESACRAGTTTSSWIGDPPATLESVAWHAANSGQRTHPVGLLKANPFGLFDVLGNLSEWVEDGFDPLSYQQHRDNLAINPNAPASDATQYVIRGHNWWEPAWNCTAWKRAPIWKDHFPRCENVGFRVALPVSAVKPADKANEATTLENPTNAPAKPVKKERGKPIGNLDTPKFHREMAESILRRGGFISVVGPNDSVEWAPHPLNADAILTTPQFKSVDELPGSDFMLSGAHLGPAQENDVDVLASFSSLRLLSFGKVSISDKNMRRLAELPQLRVLVLIDCKATETGTIELKRSKSIEYLDLGLIPLNDDILPALGEMHQLIYLSLHGTLVTDDRLDELQELRALKNLLLGNTNVTATGCARMRQMLPTCTAWLTCARCATVESYSDCTCDNGHTAA